MTIPRRCVYNQAHFERRRRNHYVTHDSDDGVWQFYGSDDFRLDDMVAVCLHHIVEKDRTLEQHLPRGWYAWRDDVSSPWMRALRDEDEERE